MTEAGPDRLAHYLLRNVNKANRLYRLFDAGDRIAVAVSGGKDSATLLELLRRWRGPFLLDLVAVHVVPAGSPCGEMIAPEELRQWLDGLGVETAVVPAEEASGRPRRARQGPCFHCAWRRRKAIFLTAQRLGCNKVALGHHADDVAVTTLLNLVYQGRCETMPPRISLFGGRLTLIRPLYLIEERRIAQFAQSGVFPFVPKTCGRGEDSRRARMKEILRLLHEENPRVRRCLMNAVEAVGAFGYREGER